MNLMWRFLWTFLFSRFAPKVDIFSECSTTFRVLPTDIDMLWHMNNGRYFSLMDIARLDFLLRCGFFSVFSKNKIYPVVASEMIRFKKSLNLFQSFQLTTRIMGWDDKFFYIEHHFKRNDEIYALSLIKSCFLRKSGGPVSSNVVANLLGIKHASPPLPEWIIEWQRAEQSFFTETNKNSEILA